MEPTTASEITLPITSSGTRVAQRRLRVLADVVPPIVERQRGIHPAVEALAEPTLTSAATFRSIYDASRTQHPHAARELKELDDAVEPVRRALQAWMGPLMAAAPAIDVKSFSNAARSPKVVIADGKRMIELVTTYQKSTNKPLPFADALIADLTEKVEVAEKELADVGELASSQAELRSEARIAAANLHRHLVGLRRSLRVLLGRNHPDYRSLLTRPRGTKAEEELDENQDAEIDDDIENGENTNPESDAE